MKKLTYNQVLVLTVYELDQINYFISTGDEINATVHFKRLWQEYYKMPYTLPHRYSVVFEFNYSQTLRETWLQIWADEYRLFLDRLSDDQIDHWLYLNEFRPVPYILRKPR